MKYRDGCWTYPSADIWMLPGKRCYLWLTPSFGWRLTVCLAGPWDPSQPLVVASQVTPSPASVDQAPRDVMLLASAVSLCQPLPSPRHLDMFAVLSLMIAVCQTQCTTLFSVEMSPVNYIVREYLLRRCSGMTCLLKTSSTNDNFTWCTLHFHIQGSWNQVMVVLPLHLVWRKCHYQNLH
jgi:hypothetical protein